MEAYDAHVEALPAGHPADPSLLALMILELSRPRRDHIAGLVREAILDELAGAEAAAFGGLGSINAVLA